MAPSPDGKKIEVFGRSAGTGHQAALDVIDRGWRRDDRWTVEESCR
jgi:hypothetical protein